MKTYAEARERLGKRASRKLENHTYLERMDDHTIGVRLHQTHVVIYRDDGTCTVSSGGWRTATTKARINVYSPLDVQTRQGVWYARYYAGGAEVCFVDGMTVKDGVITGGAPKPERLGKLKRAIGEYAKGYVAALARGEVKHPNNGDCWYCLMQTQEGRNLGEAVGDGDHIRMHMEEKYYVPSLAVNALMMFGGSIAAKDTFARLSGGELEVNCFTRVGLEQIQRMVRRYVSRQLGLHA